MSDPSGTDRADRPRRDLHPHLGPHQRDGRRRISELLASSPVPPAELPRNLSLYLDRETVGDLLTTADLYRRILDVPGEVFELGVHWGRRMSLFVALRELLEPHNYTRRIVGFDTFEGFPEVTGLDGEHALIRAGGLAVGADYVSHLTDVLDACELDGPQAHVRRYEIRTGDVRETLPRYLSDHPEAVVSLAYFDLDLHDPTRACLDLLLERMPRGSILAFDQFAQLNFPGETAAVREVMGLSGTRFERLPYHPYPVFTTL
ncbi:MAG TPA: TylF/MycF/NovP-related O-methyltransferase [Mycobacteriales bacterium]